MLDWLHVLAKAIKDRPMRQRLIGMRPVVMCLIQSTDNERYLFIRPTHRPDAWMPPQEGIEVDESLEAAATRGLHAELGVEENKIHYRRSTWLGSRITPEQQGERDIEYSLLPMRGKAYWAALIKMPEGNEITINEAEIAGHEWLSLSDVRERLDSNHQRKQQLIQQAFAQLLKTEL